VGIFLQKASLDLQQKTERQDLGVDGITQHQKAHSAFYRVAATKEGNDNEISWKKKEEGLIDTLPLLRSSLQATICTHLLKDIGPSLNGSFGGQWVG